MEGIECSYGQGVFVCGGGRGVGKVKPGRGFKGNVSITVNAQCQ